MTQRHIQSATLTPAQKPVSEVCGCVVALAVYAVLGAAVLALFYALAAQDAIEAGDADFPCVTSSDDAH
jgi:hypothetical protein